MPILTQPIPYCHNCKRFKNWGKRNCKKCYHLYGSEFKTSILTYKQVRRIKKQNSPTELIKIYDWVRENIFSDSYIPPSDKIIFSYKRNGSRGAWCDKNMKEIRMSKIETTKRKYDKETDIIKVIPKTQEELEKAKEWQYETMIHEALHLRLPHHRKSFKEKEKELVAKYQKIKATAPKEAVA